MKIGKMLKKWFAALCAAILTVSLFAIPAFAAEAGSEAKGPNVGLIVGLIVTAVILAVAVVLCIKFREKIVKFLRVYKSEAGKITWLSREQTIKSTKVVLVVLVACALVICLLDFGLSKGVLALIGLFK